MPFHEQMTNQMLRKAKTPPPDDTYQEAAYLKALGEKQTPVAVKLLDGDLLPTVEVRHQQRTRFARDGLHLRKEVVHAGSLNENHRGHRGLRGSRLTTGDR